MRAIKKLQHLQDKIKEPTKRFIRIDKHLQKITHSGFLEAAREYLRYPKNGFSNQKEYKIWQELHVDGNVKNYNAWDKLIFYATTEIAMLPLEYKSEVEMFLAFNDYPVSYDIKQSGIPHHRTDKNYLKAKKITRLYNSTSPETGMKRTANDTVNDYDIATDKQIADKYSFSEFEHQELCDNWTDNFAVDTDTQVWWIVSQFKK